MLIADNYQKKKIEWETFNTSKIKTVYYSSQYSENDFGTKIRYKCHLPTQRRKRTLDGDLCSNWQLIDSFGVRLNSNSPITVTERYENFYDDRHTLYFSSIDAEF